MSGLTQAKSAFGLQVSLVAGALADTDIAITGIATSDTIVFVMHLTIAAADITSAADLTSSTSITSAGNIQNTNDTSNDQLLVFWLDNSL